MSQDLAIFRWSRPASIPRIRKLPPAVIRRASIPRSLNTLIRKELAGAGHVAVLTFPKCKWGFYEPLRTEKPVFQALAEVSDAEDLLRFASEWGQLGVPAIELNPRNPKKQRHVSGSFEPIRAWEREICDLRRALELAGALTKGDRADVQEAVGHLLPSRKDKEGQPTKVQARLVLGRLVSRKAQENVDLAFGYDREAERHLYRPMPRSLLGACWLQVGDLVSERKVRLCARCGGWFAVNSKGRRKHDKYCGNTCRVGAARKRRRARVLYAEGWSTKRIARELGTQSRLIASWVDRRTA